MDADRARELLAQERQRIMRSLDEREPRESDEPNTELHVADQASILYDNELNESLSDDLRVESASVDRAEERLAAGTYGLSIETAVSRSRTNVSRPCRPRSARPKSKRTTSAAHNRLSGPSSAGRRTVTSIPLSRRRDDGSHGAPTARTHWTRHGHVPEELTSREMQDSSSVTRSHPKRRRSRRVEAHRHGSNG